MYIIFDTKHYVNCNSIYEIQPYIYIYILAYSISTRKGNKYGSQISCHNRAIHLVTTKTVNEKEKKKKKQSI